MPGNTRDRAIRLRAAFPRILVCPHLRLDVVNVRLAAFRWLAAFPDFRRVTRGENLHAVLHIHVVVNLVIEMEIGRTNRDGMRLGHRHWSHVIHEIKVHRAFLPLRRARLPSPAEHLAPPAGILHRNRRRVQHHKAATALEVFIYRRLLLRRRVAAFLRVKQNDVRVFELLCGRPVERAVHLDSALGEQRSPFFKKARMRVDFLAAVALAGANEDPERVGTVGADDHRCERGECEETFHGSRLVCFLKISPARDQSGTQTTAINGLP